MAGICPVLMDFRLLVLLIPVWHGMAVHWAGRDNMLHSKFLKVMFVLAN